MKTATTETGGNCEKGRSRSRRNGEKGESRATETGRIGENRGQQKQDEAEKEMERQTARSEMKVGFGRYKGRTCESIYKEDRHCCEWLTRQESTNPALF